MRYQGFVLGLIFSVAAGAGACSRTPDERATQQEAAPATAEGAKDEVTITGCLTGAPDRSAFVVTADRNALTSGALHAGSGETPTYTYELVGNAADMSPHVGRQVQVRGQVDDDRKDEVDVDNKAKSEGERVQSGDDKVTPAIETKEEVEIKVRRLRVASVTPTGGSCSAPAGQ